MIKRTVIGVPMGLVSMSTKESMTSKLSAGIRFSNAGKTPLMVQDICQEGPAFRYTPVPERRHADY